MKNPTLRLFVIFCFWLQSLSLTAFAQSSDPTGDRVKAANSYTPLGQSECDADPNRNWDPARGRCIYTQKSVDERNEYQECAGIEDADSRKACNDRFAKGKTGEMGDEDDSWMGLGLSGINLALVTINLMGVGQTGGSCISKYIFAGTAGVGVLSELYFKFMAKKQLDELRENYEKEDALEDPYASQIRAFQFLKDEQEKIADYSGKRKTAYYVLTAGYTAAAAAAVYDMFQPSCGGGGKEKGETAQKPDGIDSSATGDVKNALASIGGFGFGSPLMIMIVSGVSLTLTYKLAKAAADQQEESKANAKKVEAIMKEFQGTVAEFCPQGRDNLAEPRCYCYTDTGEQNSNRSNSETCQALWSANESLKFADKGDYGPNGEQKLGCYTVDNQYDENCKCKKFKDANGQNACKKTFTNFTSLPSNANALGFTQVASTLDSINGGTIAPGSANLNTVQNQLARANKARKALVEKMNKKLRSEGKKPLPKDAEFTKAFLKKLNKPKINQLAAASKAPSLLEARPQSGKLASALKKAAQKAELKQGIMGSSSRLGFKGKSSKKNDFNFNLGGSKSGGANKVEGAGYMDKEYEYKNSDINSDKDRDIFTIISRRYTISGLKRLFDDE
ncbi:MAG: hypothetical protein ACPGJV_04570 [Bacteriovoracaceae bacterium]